jgi:hypothetical protein
MKEGNNNSKTIITIIQQITFPLLKALGLLLSGSLKNLTTAWNHKKTSQRTFSII